ncbi:helix-turn-helix domain-containing protein [Thermococcus thermotolerans]|uniref:helix-turn-helix domain-containing protein n=1 Tax=Thermococcus thermotolerans TaxID=2969672 RepID=UPI0021580494|nr:helix-turn-helix domain-containing protein [Thermococcus thermotolerans]
MGRWMRCMGRDPENLMTFVMSLRPLLTEPKKSIIRSLAEGEKGTNEIHSELRARGLNMPRSTLYYHLSSLQDAGIIEMAGYREKGGGAPEKVWRLKVRKICIDIVTGEVSRE